MPDYTGEDLSAALQDFTAAGAGAQDLAASVGDELARLRGEMRDTSREAQGLAGAISGSLRSAFDRMITGGTGASDVLRRLGSDLAGRTFDAAIRPVHSALSSALTSGISGLISGVAPFAAGGAFSSGRLRAFAGGGVVDGPTLFGMRGGAGLMGEAGPEAVLPLQRGADGRLGVAAGGGRSVNVTVNIATPDAGSFERSRSQVAAQVARAVQRGARNA